MFEYFYNEIFRSVIIGFGSLFNGIEIKHKNSDDDTVSVIKVPLAYGPMQKFLARMQQELDLNKLVRMTLPRMSFEFVGLQYDSTRKSTQTTTIINQTPDGDNLKRNYMPVPYNMEFTLSIMTKLNDDMLQIVEQILPYFQPSYALSVNFLGNLKEQRDVPIQLNNITMTDDYEGNFDTRRALIYTLNFTAKTYVFGPIADVTNQIIKKTTIGYVAGTPGDPNATRDLTYQVTPRAVKDYDGSVVTFISQNLDLAETVFTVDDPDALTAGTYIYIGQEEMFVEKILNGKVIVKRAQDNSVPQQHVLGSKVYSITEADDELIQFGDDFGFNGTTF